MVGAEEAVLSAGDVSGAGVELDDAVRLGRLLLEGPSSWPDQLARAGHLGLVAVAGNYALGVEVGTLDGNPFSHVYLGAWAFELYVDVDGFFEAVE